MRSPFRPRAGYSRSCSSPTTHSAGDAGCAIMPPVPSDGSPVRHPSPMTEICAIRPPRIPGRCRLRALCGRGLPAALSCCCRLRLRTGMLTPRCTRRPLTPSPVLRNTSTTPAKPYPITSISTTTASRAAATAWAAPQQPIFHPSSVLLRPNFRRAFATTHSPGPSPAGRSCPSPGLPDPTR
jgi:hypothetical protein